VRTKLGVPNKKEEM